MVERRAVLCLFIALLVATVTGLSCMLISAMITPIAKLPYYASGGAEPGTGLSLRVAANGALVSQLHAPNGDEPTEPVASIQKLLASPAVANSTRTIEMLPDGRKMIVLRYFEPARNYLHWSAYELTSGSQPTARILMHHSTSKTLRQRAELNISNSIWSTTPIFYSRGGFFWTGPRLLVFGQHHYRPTTNLLEYVMVALKHSFLMWFALLCAYLAALAVAAGIFRSAVREITQNLSIILWVLIGLRLLWAAIYHDFGYSLAWLSPVITLTAFVTTIYLFHLQHFRADSAVVDERLRRRRKRKEI